MTARLNAQRQREAAQTKAKTKGKGKMCGKTVGQSTEGTPSLSRFALLSPDLMAAFQTSPDGGTWLSP